MPSPRSSSRAGRTIRDRLAPNALRVTLGLALMAALGGLTLSSYALSGRQNAGKNAPSMSAPLSSTSAPSSGSPAASAAPSTSAAAEQPSPLTPSTASAAGATTATRTVAKSTTKSVPSPGRTTAAAPAGNASYEQQVLALTNAQRAAVGCPALVGNSTLAAVARAHSQDMATKGYFDHNTLTGVTPAQRLTAAGYAYRQMAENIAAGQATPAAVMASWMASAGHKANILNCGLTELGVGYAAGGSYGSYWTQDFGTR